MPLCQIDGEAFFYRKSRFVAILLPFILAWQQIFGQQFERDISFLRNAFREMLVVLQRDLNVFVPKALFDVLGRSVILRQHGRMSVPQLVECEVLQANLVVDD